MSSRVAWWISLALTLLVCARLLGEIARNRQPMDADEAVHAVESLRRYDDLARGDATAFVRDSYFPERWQPPVQDHLRWYPIVHSLSQVLAFAAFEPSDFHARWPSLVFLAGTCLLFHALARRIAPRHGDLAGVVAVVLLLAAPNVLTFSVQSLIEACSLFFAALALHAYVRYVENPASSTRALWAGAGLSAAVLTKYDHGLMQIACLGVAEFARQRWSIARAIRSRAWLVLATPLVVLALWLAHPDKWAAFVDALSHPAYGSAPVIALNFGASWLLEYTSSPLVALFALYAVVHTLRRESDERLRAVAIYAGLAMALLALRARFQFRYNIVEAPFVLLLAASVSPRCIESLAGAYCAVSDRALRRVGWTLALVGGGGIALAVGLAASPTLVERIASVCAAPVLALPLGLTRSASEYASEFVDGARAAFAFSAWTFALTPLAFLVFAAFALAPNLRRRLRAHAGLRVTSSLACLAVLPGALHLHSPAELSRRIAWELEGRPELAEIVAFVDEHTPARARLLLGGGWDQLPNNALAWYLKTRRSPRPAYADIEVAGDMIGSLVQPSDPRIRQWADVLARDGGAELPDVVVLLVPRDDFAYRITRSPEVDIYRASLEARGAYRAVAGRTFESLGCAVELWRKLETPPPPLASTPALELLSAPRRTVGESGWLVRDDAWRHLRDPSRESSR